VAPVNTVHVSLATAWELAIKESLGRLRLPEPFEACSSERGSFCYRFVWITCEP
jgi:PIN domain nuclease of toxin-antitoxin system